MPDATPHMISSLSAAAWPGWPPPALPWPTGVRPVSSTRGGGSAGASTRRRFTFNHGAQACRRRPFTVSTAGALNPWQVAGRSSAARRRCATWPEHPPAGGGHRTFVTVCAQAEGAWRAHRRPCRRRRRLPADRHVRLRCRFLRRADGALVVQAAPGPELERDRGRASLSDLPAFIAGAMASQNEPRPPASPSPGTPSCPVAMRRGTVGHGTQLLATCTAPQPEIASAWPDTDFARCAAPLGRHTP